MWDQAERRASCTSFESAEMRSASRLHIVIDRAVLIGLFTINICRCQSGRLWENGFFQHEAECSEKSLVLALLQTEEETEIYIQRDKCSTPGGAHVHLKISQQGRQERQTDWAEEILNYPIISRKRLLSQKWQIPSAFVLHAGNMPVEFQIWFVKPFLNEKQRARLSSSKNEEGDFGQHTNITKKQTHTYVKKITNAL